MTDQPVLKDLSKLATDRCRDAFMTVGQLVEDDMERSAMLATVALDMMRGAAAMIANSKEISESRALVLVFNQMATTIEKKVDSVAVEETHAHKGPTSRRATGGGPKGDG